MTNRKLASRARFTDVQSTKSLPVILIPAFNPNCILIELCEQLATASIRSIIVIDDGSHLESQDIFKSLRQLTKVEVISHPINCGKGEALKTGFRHILEKYDETSCTGVVTADADGQHDPTDILKVCKELQKDCSKIVLGIRDFARDIPFRSLIGNRVTSFLFRLFSQIPLRDTQTGLRGYSLQNLRNLLPLSGSRYEYELAMLIVAVRRKIPLNLIPIQTIYLDGNKDSHFHPLKDSLLIGKSTIKYFFCSMKSLIEHKTDWDSYYSNPRRVTSFTRKVTENFLMSSFAKNLPNPENFSGTFCELGGANSCFVDSILQRFPRANYVVVDTNPVGLKLLSAKQEVYGDRLRMIQADVVATVLPPLEVMNSDVVFSVGLIEHFSAQEMRKALRFHFACAKQDGLVVVTFPTGTFLYWIMRSLIQISGQWIFHDENPLSVPVVRDELSRYARVIKSQINWGTLLTQGAIVARYSGKIKNHTL